MSLIPPTIVVCPRCSQPLSIDERQYSQNVACPYCNHLLHIVRPEANTSIRQNGFVVRGSERSARKKRKSSPSLKLAAGGIGVVVAVIAFASWKSMGSNEHSNDEVVKPIRSATSKSNGVSPIATPTDAQRVQVNAPDFVGSYPREERPLKSIPEYTPAISWTDLREFTGHRTRDRVADDGDLVSVEATRGISVVSLVKKVPSGYAIALSDDRVAADFCSRRWFAADERTGLQRLFDEYIEDGRKLTRAKKWRFIGRWYARLRESTDYPSMLELDLRSREWGEVVERPREESWDFEAPGVVTSLDDDLKLACERSQFARFQKRPPELSEGFAEMYLSEPYTDRLGTVWRARLSPVTWTIEWYRGSSVPVSGQVSEFTDHPGKVARVGNRIGIVIEEASHMLAPPKLSTTKSVRYSPHKVVAIEIIDNKDRSDLWLNVGSRKIRLKDIYPR